jgi:putative transposase
MALSQSALSELLDAFRAGDGVDPIRDAVQLVPQDGLPPKPWRVADS